MFEVKKKSAPRPVRRYRLRKDLPREFHPDGMFRFTDQPLRAGEVCEYLEHSDKYTFPARGTFVPWIPRRTVEAWDEFFKPLREERKK